jgi:hypothetical protein
MPVDEHNIEPPILIVVEKSRPKTEQGKAHIANPSGSEDFRKERVCVLPP